MHFTLNCHWIKLYEACRKKGLGAHDFPELHLQQLILQIALKYESFFPNEVHLTCVPET